MEETPSPSGPTPPESTGAQQSACQDAGVQLTERDWKHRDNLRETASKAWSSYDKNSLYLSVGALAASLVFIKDVRGGKFTSSGCLLFGWCFLLASIGVGLFSHYASATANEQAIEEFDANAEKKKLGERYHSEKRKIWDSRVRRANFTVGILLILGVLSLLLFVFFNMGDAQ